MRNVVTRLIGVGLVVAAQTMLVPAVCGAQEAAPPPAQGEAAELAKKLSNPISNLVSVPFQLNWEQGVGPNDQTRFVLNVQPVMPFTLNKDWNLIARVIMPFVSQPPLAEGGTAAFGVSDVLASAFFSPSKGGLIWGVGPVVSLPSTTQSTLGSEKWSAGPTVVMLKQIGPWTVGLLWNQVWSFAGNAERKDVSQMYFQPFLSHTSKSLVTVSIASESTANWKVSDHRWTVPIIGSVSKLSSFGMFPASYMIGVGTFVAKPDGAPSWKLRAAMTILLPKKK
jgi:hypothetical protein